VIAAGRPVAMGATGRAGRLGGPHVGDGADGGGDRDDLGRDVAVRAVLDRGCALADRVGGGGIHGRGGPARRRRRGRDRADGGRDGDRLRDNVAVWAVRDGGRALGNRVGSGVVDGRRGHLD